MASVSAPTNQLIDTSFSLRLTFSYFYDLDITGYSPFVDVVLPTSTLRSSFVQSFGAASNPDFSVQSKSAVIPLFSNCTAAQAALNATCVNITYGCVTHPLAPAPLDPQAPKVCGQSGDTVLSLSLSFAPLVQALLAQTVTLSGLVLRSNPGVTALPNLPVYARAGYQFENLGGGVQGSNIRFGEAQNRSELWTAQTTIRPQFMVWQQALAHPLRCLIACRVVRRPSRRL